MVQDSLTVAGVVGTATTAASQETEKKNNIKNKQIVDKYREENPNSSKTDVEILAEYYNKWVPNCSKCDTIKLFEEQRQLLFAKVANKTKTAEEQKQQMLAEIDAKIEELQAKIAEKEKELVSLPSILKRGMNALGIGEASLLNTAMMGMGSISATGFIYKAISPMIKGKGLSIKNLALGSICALVGNFGIIQASNETNKRTKMQHKLEQLQQQRQEIQNTDFTAMA